MIVCNLLQWSHDVTVVEMALGRASNCSTATLQWSHDVTVVEIRMVTTNTTLKCGASMEPRRHRRGDGSVFVLVGGPGSTASMEPRRHRRGDHHSTLAKQ